MKWREQSEALESINKYMPDVLFTDITEWLETCGNQAIFIRKSESLIDMMCSNSVFADEKKTQQSLKSHLSMILACKVQPEKIAAAIAETLGNNFCVPFGNLSVESIVKLIEEYFQENYSRPIDLSDLSEKFGFSGP